MHDMLKKLAKKSKGRDLSPAEVEAKSSVLHHLIGDMDSMMGDKLKNMKKVSVSSDSPEGLAEGLKKAQELVDHAGDKSEYGNIKHTELPDEEEHLEEDGPSELQNQFEQEEDKDEDLDEAKDEDKHDQSDMEEKLKKLKALKERA